MRRLRALAIFELGAWIGMLAAAALVRRALPSRGDEESDELALVAVPGIEVDLREAQLAPGAACP